MTWYNTFKTLVHAERIYRNNSGTHYTIIIRFLKNAYYPHMLARLSIPLFLQDYFVHKQMPNREEEKFAANKVEEQPILNQEKR